MRNRLLSFILTTSIVALSVPHAEGAPYSNPIKCFLEKTRQWALNQVLTKNVRGAIGRTWSDRNPELNEGHVFEEYWVQLNGSVELKRWRLVGFENYGTPKIRFIFEETANGSPRRIFVSREDIHACVNIRPKSPQEGLVQPILERTKSEIANLILGALDSEPTRYQMGGFQVKAKPEVKQDGIEALVQDLNRFDDYWNQRGLKKPPTTEIYISPVGERVTWDPPHLNRGPGVALIEKRNFFSRTIKGFMYFEPLAPGQSGFLQDRTVSGHERAHLILAASFSKDAFLMNAGHLEEALCDVMAADISSNPVIGETGRGFSLRNLSSPEDLNARNRQPIALVHIPTNDPHTASLIYSPVLWELRRALPREGFSAELVNLLDDLNRYRPSFSKVRARLNPQGEKPRQMMISDVEYFLAVILRHFRGSPHQLKVEEALRSTFSNLSLDRDRVTRIMNELILSENTYRRER